MTFTQGATFEDKCESLHYIMGASGSWQRIKAIDYASDKS